LFVGGDAVQISRHLGNAAYNVKMLGRTPVQWVSDVRQVLGVAQSVLSRIQTMDGLFEFGRQSASRRDQILQDCDVLRQNGVDEQFVSCLRDLLLFTLNELPFQLQHGDLWPANVLEAGGRWWLIDFSECGLVWTPGYDLMMLLANSPGGFSTQWIGASFEHSPDRWDRARSRIIKGFAEQHGWSSNQIGLMVLHFLLRITAYRMRPGVEAELWEYWRDELVRVCRRLMTDSDPAGLVRPAD
jgi:Ser/Thr protein kinase RdoA (MazF antagonist)